MRQFKMIHKGGREILDLRQLDGRHPDFRRTAVMRLAGGCRLMSTVYCLLSTVSSNVLCLTFRLMSPVSHLIVSYLMSRASCEMGDWLLYYKRGNLSIVAILIE